MIYTGMSNRLKSGRKIQLIKTVLDDTQGIDNVVVEWLKRTQCLWLYDWTAIGINFSEFSNRWDFVPPYYNKKLDKFKNFE